jgi:hypothetical protein
MFCAKCGSRVPEGNRFCNQCGAAVSVPPAPSPAGAPPRAVSQPAFPQGAAPYAAHPQPVYAAQPQAAYAAPPQPLAGGPVPPGMHWALVLVLAWVTLGIFGVVWVFKQAGFVQKIDPTSKAKMLLALGVLAMFSQVALILAGIALGSTEMIALLSILMMLLYVGYIVAWLLAIFGMRNSLLKYYNTVEPIGLKLSGAMTFFFNFLYFQYHFARIAEWKRTGRLA